MSESGSQSTHEHFAQVRVLSYIGRTFADILSELQVRPHGKPQIVLRRPIDVNLNGSLNINDTDVRYRTVNYAWPGRNHDEAWRFACVGQILSEIHLAIQTGVVRTKRDIYYRTPVLFRDQTVIDQYIDDIAFTCNVTRSALNITASPKGLLAGFPHATSQTTLIPDCFDIEKTSFNHVRWVLVVEKEASFKYLTETGFHVNNEHGPGILLTGKGYPDLASKRFLRAVVDRISAGCPVYGLFDADPDGVDIFRCYTLGSTGLAQEMASKVPEVQWIGAKFGDLGMQNPDSCTTLTSRDRRKARSVLDRCGNLSNDSSNSQILSCREILQGMLLLNVKAEIQALDGFNSGMLVWLQTAMKQPNSSE